MFLDTLKQICANKILDVNNMSIRLRLFPSLYFLLILSFFTL